MHEEKNLLTGKVDPMGRFAAGGLGDLGSGFGFFLWFCFWLLLLKANLVFPHKCAELRVIVLLAI